MRTTRLPRLFLLVLLLGPGPLAAQVPEGDRAWEAGDFPAASRAYHQALVNDPASVRSLYRLGLLASWDNRLDSALGLLERARRVDPEDPDVRYAEALVRSWDGQYSRAVAQFDSLLALHPDRRDAAMARANTLAWQGRFGEAVRSFDALLAADPADVEARVGRAQVLAWAGRHEAASLEYGAVLASDPERADALVGLGRLRLWQGRADLAEASARRALQNDPHHADARLLLREVRTAVRPYLDLVLGWSRDSDENVLWWQEARADVPMGPRLRALGGVGLAEASDPVRNGTRSFGEAGVRAHVASVTVTVLGGVRTLNPHGEPGRTAATGRAVVTWRAAPRVLLGAGVAAYPFDETAFLLTQDVDVVDAEASAEVALTDGLDLGLGASAGWLSDDNSRWSVAALLTQDLPSGFFVGGYGRYLSYDRDGLGYFSPDSYTLLEGRAGWVRDHGTWTWRIMGGLGAQWIASGSSAQSEWRVEASAGHRVGTDGRLEAFGGFTNAAESSTTGAYRYGTAGLRLRLGL